MDAAAEAAVGAGDDVLFADEFSERDDAIGYQFRVLDEVGGVADDTRNQDLPGGEFHVQMAEDRWIRATVVEVEAPRRFVLTWRWETTRAAGISRVEVSLAARADGSVVRIAHTGLPPELVRLYREGWVHRLESLARAASAGNPGAVGRF